MMSRTNETKLPGPRLGCLLSNSTQALIKAFPADRVFTVSHPHVNFPSVYLVGY